MTDNSQTTEEQAKAMYEAVAPNYGLPLWDDAGPSIREAWRWVATKMRKISESITYDD